MAVVQAYVVVDPAAKTIVGGPYNWDGETEWTAPEITANPDAGYIVIMLDQANAEGYTWPLPPSQPYVVADPNTMLIVAGPVDWNGYGDLPLRPTVLMPESEALGAGYNYPQP